LPFSPTGPIRRTSTSPYPSSSPAPAPISSASSSGMRCEWGERLKDEPFPRPAKESAAYLLTRMLQVNRTSTLRSLPAAPWSADGAMRGRDRGFPPPTGAGGLLRKLHLRKN
jgi:hypothetical protein